MTNIIFFGNSKYSAIVAKALLTEYGLSSVVTIPDRPIGRKKILTSSPVKQFAVEHNVAYFTFDKLDDRAIEAIIRSVISPKSVKRDPSTRPVGHRDLVGMTWGKPDFLVVADYGLILPKELLATPKYTALNVHHSLLPKYRGPSPAPTTILNGDKVSGVTIIKMTDKVDAGPILAQKEYELTADETTDSLLTTLNTIGGELVVDVIANYQSIKPIPQDESKASMTKRMTKQDGYIDLTHPPSPDKLDRMIRAYFPWPNVWTRVVLRSDLGKGPTFQKERIIKFLPRKASPYEANEQVLIHVEGGKPMSIKDFLNGYPEMKGKIEKLF